MKRVLFIILFLTIVVNLLSSELVTVAEQSDYKRTSSYNEVMAFLYTAQTRSDKIQMVRLTTSSEGRMVPLLVISSEGIKSPKELTLSGKPALLIMANIHAGEIEGKEATLMLIRDFVKNKDSQHLENQVVLVIPIFNPDGNDKFGKNRRDNGPELAGTRYNGQFLDLNRDYLKLESPEVKGLVTLFNQWDPVLVVDMHTTNGSYHREPVTYTTNVNPNGDLSLSTYMWKHFFPGTAKILKDTYGYDSLPYGNFIDRTKPEQGWRNHAFLARYGNNYAGLRNRFTVLDENYSHADFKTRVLASYGFIKSILQYTHQHIKEMEKMVKAVDINTKNNYAREHFVLEFANEKLFDVTVKSYEFEIEKIKEEDRDKYPPWYGEYIAKKTDVFKDYPIPYFSRAVPTRTIPLPNAYILFPYYQAIINNLKHHGIVVEKIRKPFRAEVEVFRIKEIKPAKRLYQGHVIISLKGHYVPETLTIPENSFLIPMKQPLARLIPVLLEPESQDSLAAWGFFNRQLVSQWTDKPLLYPVYRLHKKITFIERYQE
ncbi:MAG: M14 family metallopeptidase [Candidatus Aminicenantes bacterium]|jgi:hypothetical protein